MAIPRATRTRRAAAEPIDVAELRRARVAADVVDRLVGHAVVAAPRPAPLVLIHAAFLLARLAYTLGLVEVRFRVKYWDTRC